MYFFAKMRAAMARFLGTRVPTTGWDRERIVVKDPMPEFLVDVSLFDGKPYKPMIQIGPGRKGVMTYARQIAKSWHIGHRPGVLPIGNRQRLRRNALFLRRAYERKIGVRSREFCIRGLLSGGQCVIRRRFSLNRWMPGAA